MKIKCDRNQEDPSVKHCNHRRKINGMILCAKVPSPIPWYKDMSMRAEACWLDEDQGED